MQTTTTTRPSARRGDEPPTSRAGGDFASRPSIPIEDLGDEERLILALARLSAWREDPADMQPGWTPRVRAWKGYSFPALRRLEDAGCTIDRAHNKSVILTEEGVALAERTLEDLGLTPPPIPLRSRKPSA